MRIHPNLTTAFNAADFVSQLWIRNPQGFARIVDWLTSRYPSTSCTWVAEERSDTWKIVLFVTACRYHLGMEVRCVIWSGGMPLPYRFLASGGWLAGQHAFANRRKIQKRSFISWLFCLSHWVSVGAEGWRSTSWHCVSWSSFPLQVRLRDWATFPSSQSLREKLERTYSFSSKVFIVTKNCPSKNHKKS